MTVSALPGGAADKLGGRYEDWWTLFRVADLLKGAASCLRMEPPGAAGTGIEFWVDEPSGRWCEQVKDAPAKGPWTLRRLTTEGVLPSVSAHLAAGHRVRLVFSTAAADLITLADRARATESIEEYREVLTKPQQEQLEQLAQGWDVAQPVAWDRLSRVFVEHHPPEQLRRLVDLTYSMLVQGDPALVVAELRNWLDDVLHRSITGPLAWQHLKSKGFRRRVLAGDSTALSALANGVERHGRRVDGARPTWGTVARPELDGLVQRLKSAARPPVVVVHGAAGSGKSTVAIDAVRRLQALGWFAAALSLDATQGTVRSAAALGRDVDLDGSPAVVLAGVSNGSPAVLLVDQLDAVSEYSGRMPDSYVAVAELLEQAALLPGLSVVLVVRSVDLRKDRRMSALVSDATRVEMLEVGDLSADSVAAVLRAAGVDVDRMDPVSLTLLRVPLHLAVFCQLSEERQGDPLVNRASLYEAFTAELRQRVERQTGHLEWAGITGALVASMSDREALQAPDAVLDMFPVQEIAALVSAGVLVRDGSHIRFFHETYFDFIFARGFVTSGRQLHDFLTTSGQHLFRRAQTRQVLEYLAACDRDMFRRTVAQLLTSTTIRSHLLDIVVSVLQQLVPEPADWLVLEPLAFGSSLRVRQLAGLLSSGAWFDAADQAGRWEPLLRDPSTQELAADQLVIAARERPKRVEHLVRPYIGASDAWRRRLHALVEWSLSPDLVDLAVELLESGDLDNVRGPIAINSDFWSIIYGLRQEDAQGAARMIGAYLRRAIERARADGSNNPFRSGHIPQSSSGSDTIILEVAEAAPGAFVREVMPFVVELTQATATPDAWSGLRAGAEWHYRHFGEQYGVDGAVFAGLEKALRRLAENEPGSTSTVIQPLMDSDLEQLRFLACRTLSAARIGNDAITWLLVDDANLQLGWSDSSRWATRELIEVSTCSCDDQRLTALTDRLLRYWPAHERTFERRHAFGRAQYELLSGVAPTRRSAQVTRRLEELERKFATLSWGLRPPKPNAAHWVGSALPNAAAEVMTDEHWQRAIVKHRDEEPNWSDDHPVGGSRELARSLGARAQAQPERFAGLALTFDQDTPAVYLEEVIRAVTGQIPVPLLSAVCQHARDVAGQAVGRAICAASEADGAAADERLLELLESCATDDDPDNESARMPASTEGQYYYGGDLLTAGLNCTRGAVAKAMAHILFTEPEHADRLAPTVAALAVDPILAVRTMAADAVVALMNHRSARGLDLAEKLFDAADDIYDSVTVIRLLQLVLLREPTRFAPQLACALKGSDPVARRAGQVWAVAFFRNVLRSPVPSDLADLPRSARRGAAEAVASDPAAAPDLLVTLFDDEDVAVREAAASAVRHLPDTDRATADLLVSAFLRSKAFEEHFDDLFFAIDQIPGGLPSATLAACERAVQVAQNELGDIRTRRDATSNDVISVVLRLYREGGTPVRSRCLDLVDALSDVQAYGLEQALAEER